MKESSLKIIAERLFLFGVVLLACSLPYSNFLMSLAQIILIASWLMAGAYAEKIAGFLKNRTAVIVCSVFLIHIIGLAYTSDFVYGLEDVRKKIPLMLLPFLFATAKPFSKKIIEIILLVFVLSVLAATFICFYVLLGFTDVKIIQPQSASIFISHIRFGLLISFSIFILIYIFAQTTFFLQKIICLFIIAWFIVFLIMMESATGILCTALVSFLLLILYLVKMKNILFRVLGVAALSGVLIFLCFLFFHKSKNPSGSEINYQLLPLATKNGNTYLHDTANTESENGNRVWLYVCEKELSAEWNKRSKLDYSGKDLKENNIKYTIIRFLTSKDLPKDSIGVNALSDEEIAAIERGIPNTDYMGIFNPRTRFLKIFWEFDNYQRGGNPSGHSVVQRLEFWKAALGIIKENPLIGVGTGDVKNAFSEQYEKTNSPLTKEWRLRSHNQFLSIGVGFGVIGLLWFLFTLFFPFINKHRQFNMLYVSFFLIAFLSMLTEDTLESQAGVTFFAFFNSFFLFLNREEI